MGHRTVISIAGQFSFFAALLFGGAGTVMWLEGWFLLLLTLAGAMLILIRLKQHDPDLLAERLKFSIQKRQPFWDKMIMLSFMAVGLAWTLAVGFEAVRVGYSFLHWSLQLVGVVLYCAGLWIQYRALMANSFLIPVVRLQAERGQHVISTGPYRYVRHPFYSAVCLLSVGASLLLASLIGVGLSICLILLLCIRIVKEEALLLSGLPTYPDYCRDIRYRLIPCVW